MKINNSINRKFTAAAGFVVGGWMAVCAAPGAGAQVCMPLTAFGDVEHPFSIRVNGNLVPIVTAKHFAHAWTRVPGVFDPLRPCPDYDVVPWALQSPDWHAHSAYGRDHAFRRNQIRTTRVPNTGTVVVNVQQDSVGAAGGTFGGTALAAGCDPDAYAKAVSSVVIDPYTFIANSQSQLVATIVSGTMKSSGEICQLEGRAYAYAMTGLEVQGGREFRSGRVKWKRAIREQVINFMPRPRKQRDPIEYEVVNLNTGEVSEGELLTVFADYPVDTMGGVNWDNDVLVITAQDVDFVIDHSHPALSAQGSLRISVRGGVVIASGDSGMYAGMAPPLGAPTPVAMPLVNDLEFDYDLGHFNGDPLEVTLEFGGSWEFDDGFDFGLPCVADLDGDGVVGASDMALLLGAWGSGGIVGDLNGDGVVNAADMALMLGAWGPCP